MIIEQQCCAVVFYFSPSISFYGGKYGRINNLRVNISGQRVSCQLELEGFKHFLCKPGFIRFCSFVKCDNSIVITVTIIYLCQCTYLSTDLFSQIYCVIDICKSCAREKYLKIKPPECNWNVVSPSLRQLATHINILYSQYFLVSYFAWGTNSECLYCYTLQNTFFIDKLNLFYTSYFSIW